MRRSRLPIRRTARRDPLTWFLTGTALTLWLFRKFISRKLAPFFPDRTTRHRFLAMVIIAFAIVAVVRLVALYAKG